MFFTMPFSTTASRRFLTFLEVIFTSLPPHVLSSMDLRDGGRRMLRGKWIGRGVSRESEGDSESRGVSVRVEGVEDKRRESLALAEAMIERQEGSRTVRWYRAGSRTGYQYYLSQHIELPIRLLFYYCTNGAVTVI
jgi:hypothetical protein